VAQAVENASVVKSATLTGPKFSGLGAAKSAQSKHVE